ncbi:sensory box/GGDEF family protein [Trabulsiella guamensis ATCC 49490]|uniref:Sensory box/GGDEF family protein n=1 Tax=Trabulsiella guamensis ATCC 49490 TaxID=1005994 RepID=A0A085AIK4_9ENTR|nr:EAL domain-containing protein [Trabulsiella guamensis]KFC10049.1 sensory box/GGDEF family protein [Trabulsiella guamensis ATCC 49490]
MMNYDITLILVSLLAVIAASGIGLWLAFSLRLNRKSALVNCIAAALVMGLAIAAMHYTGISAATFSPHDHALPGSVSERGFSVWVFAPAFAILGVMLVMSILDSRRRTIRLTEHLQRLNQQLEQQAHYDGLTGLANRTQIDLIIERCIKNALPNRQSFALILIDLDRFRLVNDAWGLHVGDRLLVSVANRISTCLSARMTLARLSSDEFILLAQDTDAHDAAELAARIAERFKCPFYESGQIIQVSLSMGISLFPDHGVTLHDLKLRADTALYNIKQQGRNGWAIYHDSMMQKAWESARFLQDLTQAMALNQFELWYQPKFNAQQLALSGFEALLRWRHPVKGVLLPEQFLELLEKSGQMVPVGRWVIDQVCRQLQVWAEQGRDDWTLSVNLSTAQFEQDDIFDLVSDALNRYRISPVRLTLELTESTALRNLARSIEILNDFARLGITVSIDDFGTGYSNLLTLKNLPARELKIDKRVVKEMRENGKNIKIVSAIIDIAHTMNMNVVAEGIETLEQKQLLTEMGCGQLQGYLLARPVPAQELPALLDNLPFRQPERGERHTRTRFQGKSANS